MAVCSNTSLLFVVCRKIVRTRRRHEYKIIRRTKEKECYLDYIKVSDADTNVRTVIEFVASMKVIFSNSFNFVER